MSGTVDDLASLSELDEKSLLEQIQARYEQQKIYTYIGDIIIAVNPYNSLPIYGQASWMKYKDLKIRSELPPHIYEVSDSAYQNLKRNRFNQCCVVSGESGAGKTESTKLIIEHIVKLCQQETNQLHQRIVQVNPLLEAFGNAQTVINDNSSRFGKFIELNFDSNGQILGGSISEYLLEKSRVVSHNEGERSFHIFYYLFAGLDKERRDANLLNSAEDHRIMRQFPGEKIYEDKAEMAECKKKWDELLSIMTSVGFIELEIDGILAILAAILHIADVKFIPDPNSDGVLIQNENILGLISELLVVKAEELVKALISNTSSVGTEKVTSLKNESQANDGRDALAKALYGRLFTWIVSKINSLLKIQGRMAADEMTIGILDIYGFENFKNNSFEQLCINIANEQLQYFFNYHIFQLELDEYKSEGIPGSAIKFVDNRPLLDLFMDRLGMFDLLDEESRFPQGTDQTLIDKFAKNLSKNPEFKLPKGQGLQFMITHFAGSVTYSAQGFLEKNRDTLSDSITRCLKTSTSLLVTEIFNLMPEVKAGTFGRNLRISVLMKGPVKMQSVNSAALKKAFNPSGTLRANPSMSDGMVPGTKTLANNFKTSLDSLLQKLMAAQPHFIRCIKPNAAKEPNHFDKSLVLQQLSYTGVLETVKIRRQGYSSRLTFPEFVQRYGLISSVFQLTPNDNGSGICEQIMNKSGLKDWQIGKTKVFLKYQHVEQLNLMVTEASKKVVACQKFWRSVLAQRKLKSLKAMAKDCSDQWQAFCKVIGEIGEKEFSIQKALNEQDIEDHQTFLEAERKRKEMEKISASQSPIRKKPADTVRAPPSSAPKSTVDKLFTPSVNIGGIPEESSEISFLMSLPDGFTGRQTVNSTTQILLTETLGKLGQLSTEIWAKLYYMEKNAIIGKVYLRDWEVVIDDTDTEYNGLVIGINSSAFDHLDDSESRSICKAIGKGVNIVRDVEGNIYLKKLSKCDIFIKGYSDPDRFCFSQEVGASEGKLKYDQIKVFDMKLFKQRLIREIPKTNWDPYYLARLCAFSFAFVKECTRDVETPCWVCLINFLALDLFGKPAVIDELQKTMKLSDKDLKEAKTKWAALDFRRRIDGFGGGRPNSSRDSARM